ncbi:MAG: DHA2 family efflux MFS transporter permease subunit [Gaiellaceae bacterium]
MSSGSIAPALGKGGRRRAALVASILGSAIVFVDGTVVNVALPAIQRDLGGGLTLQQWVVDSYLLTLGSLILVGGSLGDLFGERRIFALGAGCFGVTSVACALAPNGTTLIVMRGFQGTAGALLTPAALATITATFSGEERGAAIGTWTAWTGVSTVAGPLLGGWLVEVASWRAIFLINVPVVLVTLGLIAVAIPARPQGAARASVDVIGALLCVGGLGGIVFGLIEEPRHGWTSPAIVATLAGGALACAAFLAWEQRTRQPMMPLSLFARPNFGFANLETFSVYAGLSTLTFFLVLFLQQLDGYSAFRSGLALLPVTVLMFTLSGLVGRTSATVGPRIFMGAGPLLCAVGALALMRLGPGSGYWLGILPPLVVFGIGLALIVAPLTTTVLADADADDAGIASGINNAVSRIAGLIGIAAIGVAVGGRGNGLDLHGFRLAMGITAGLLAVGGAIGLIGIRNPG